MYSQTSAYSAGTFQNLSPAEQDSVDISLITCSPGTELYQLYGHTALRVREVRQGRRSDWVFNYGTFSFKQKNFMWRFMLGETDYGCLTATSTKNMCAKDEPSMSSV